MMPPGIGRVCVVVLIVAVLAVAAVAANNVSVFSNEEAVAQANCFEVLLDGESLGLVNNKAPISEAYERLSQPEFRGFAAQGSSSSRLQFRLVSAKPSEEILSSDTVVEQIRSEFGQVSQGAAIVVDGEAVAVLPSVEAAESVLKEILQEYSDGLLDGKEGQIEKVEFTLEPSIEEREVKLGDVSTKQQAKKILLRGTTKEITHQVEQGETLWGIANKSEMTVEELKKANPSVSNPKTLQPGQKLSLVVPDPYLVIEGVHTETFERVVPPRTQVRYDGQMWPWETKVKQPGEDGLLEITEEVHTENGQETQRKELSREKLKDPVVRIVVKGNRTIPPHGTGKFMWPVNGSLPITSHFGWRWRGFHTGVDLGGPIGTAVWAADAGIVTFAGWRGSYGNTIIVDHGRGETVTLYGHLSRMNVSVGDKVKQGQRIGAIGNSGRSTGPHLHFEIRLDGSPVNPIKVFEDQ